jgi:acyl-CoA synthetase (AMP-forming)/AMP-acid ligase II
MGLYDYTIYNIIKRNALVHGNRTAWICGDRNVTHNEFLERVDRLACGLSEMGIKKGDRIGVLAENSLEFIYLYGVCAKIGAVMLPINWRLSPEEIEYIIADGAPKIVFAGSKDMIVPIMPKCSFVEKWCAVGKGGEGLVPFNDLMENDGVFREMDVDADAPYLIIHTAAVGGRPRGATLSQNNLLVVNLLTISSLGLSSEDCSLCALPLFHIAGLGISLSIMQAGGTSVILPRFDPDLALKQIQEHKATVFMEFPPMLAKMLEAASVGEYELSSLKTVMGMEPPDMIKKGRDATGATFWTGYGQSETAGIICYAPYFDRLGSAGRPGFLADVEISDDSGKIVETGETGEIVVRGPVVFKGYWNLEEDNKHTFRDGWHHTGDMGCFDAEGYLWYEGRKPEKELIKPGGENVYPSEVETAILEHVDVSEVCVIGVQDEKWGEAIKAVCVLKKGKTLDAETLIEFVASRIARYKKPKTVVYVDSLPKTKVGEVDRIQVKKEHGGEY